MPIERVTRFKTTTFQAVSTGNTVTRKEMGFTFNTYILRTPSGLLKILELVCVLVCLVLARVGRDGDPLSFGSYNNEFLGKGIVVGYAIIVPAVLFTYLLGANLTFLELFINFIGGLLFITCGALCIQTYENVSKNHYHAAGMALGCMAVATGIVFLIDFIFAIKKTRVTIIQTI